MEEYYQKQLNESYNGRLNELFEEWKASCSESDRAADRFCEDGLTLKYKDVESGYDINAEWERAARRIMFIVKDCPDGWGYDTRRLLVGYPDNEASRKGADKTRNLKGGFFKNIAVMLYELYNMTEENKALEPILSQNITQSQMPINNQTITIIIKSKYYRISLAISIFGCIFGCRISNTPSHEHQTKHHFCT